MLSSSGEAGEVERFLRTLKATMPAGFQPRIIMSDKALAYTAAIAREFPHTIHRWCHWHTIESWRRWLVNASNGVKDATVRYTIREVRARVCAAKARVVVISGCQFDVSHFHVTMSTPTFLWGYFFSVSGLHLSSHTGASAHGVCQVTARV